MPAFTLKPQVVEHEFRKPLHRPVPMVKRNRRTLKRSIEDTETTTLKPRRLAALAMTSLGVILIALSAGIVVMRGAGLTGWLTIGLGVLLAVLGLVLLVAERLETWLSSGQTALVDGLQAG